MLSVSYTHLTHVIDGRIGHSVLLELFTEGGIGTMVTPPASDV